MFCACACRCEQDQAFATNTAEPYIYEVDLDEKAMTSIVNMTLASAPYPCARYVYLYGDGHNLTKVCCKRKTLFFFIMAEEGREGVVRRPLMEKKTLLIERLKD